MATQVLLTEDVEDLGRSGEVVTVKPGYARNFLFPQQKAVVADKRALQMQVRLQEERRKKAEEEKKEAQKLAERFEDLVLERVVKVDPAGHLYGSVTVVDIVEMLQERLGVQLEKRCVLLKHPIKVLGDHVLELMLHEEVPVTFTLKVIPERAEEEEAPAAE